MNSNNPKYVGKKRKTSPVPYFAVLAFLILAYLISSKLRSSNQEERLSGIKVEKEVSVLLTELGYPGDDPTVAPAGGWEWQEDGTLDHWYYLSSHGKTYVIQEDGTYVPEE